MDLGTDTGAPTLAFHGVNVQATTPAEAAAEVIQRAVDGVAPTTYRLVNSYSLALASRDAAYMALLRGPGVNLPDGRPLAAVLDRTGGSPCQQVRGPALFERCLDQGRAQGLRHFFLGGSEETLAALRSAAERKFPGVAIAGSWSPPFRPLSDAERQEQDELIRRSGANLVWVGLGTPKQDFEALRIARQVGVTTAAVGAAFDFTAETKRRAPQLLHRLSLEWLFRLATEPRRLWKRYLFGNARFLILAMQHRRAGRA